LEQEAGICSLECFLHNFASIAGLTISLTSLVWPPPEKITFQADHPFNFYLLKSERDLDTSLFMGNVKGF